MAAAKSVATVRSADVPGFSPRSLSEPSNAIKRSGHVLGEGAFEQARFDRPRLIEHRGRDAGAELPFDQRVRNMREEAEIDARHGEG